MALLQNPVAASIAFGVFTVGIAAWGHRRVRGTTLAGPWGWAVFSGLLLAITEAIIFFAGAPTAGWQTTARFVAATTTFLPTVSLLGAKRPQEKAWHLIVLSLWIVLILPAAESYFVRRGGAIQIHDARGWFLWVLAALGFANYALTRHVAAAACVLVGQICLLAPQLPVLRADYPWSGCAAMLLLAALVLIIAQSKSSGDLKESTTQTWQAFCHAYGMLWGMRVAERVNALPDVQEIPARLEWCGVQSDSELTPQQQDTLDRGLRSHLARFVPADWPARR